MFYVYAKELEDREELHMRMEVIGRSDRFAWRRGNSVSAHSPTLNVFALT
jgi:hypothetical protein